MAQEWQPCLAMAKLSSLVASMSAAKLTWQDEAPASNRKSRSFLLPACRHTASNKLFTQPSCCALQAM